jgi:hypothetical protein
MEQIRSPVEGYGGAPVLATILMQMYILKHCETTSEKLSSSYHCFVAFEDFNGQAPIPESANPGL